MCCCISPAVRESGSVVTLRATAQPSSTTAALTRYNNICMYMYTHVHTLYYAHQCGVIWYYSLVSPVSCSLQGEFRNGVMHGRGRYSWPDGVAYEVGVCVCTQLTSPTPVVWYLYCTELFAVLYTVYLQARVLFPFRALQGEFTSCHITGSGVYYWPDGR